MEMGRITEREVSVAGQTLFLSEVAGKGCALIL